jgi:hypothetical protein
LGVHNVYLLTWNSREFELDFFFPFMTEQDLPLLFAAQDKPARLHARGVAEGSKKGGIVEGSKQKREVEFSQM